VKKKKKKKKKKALLTCHSDRSGSLVFLTYAKSDFVTGEHGTLHMGKTALTSAGLEPEAFCREGSSPLITLVYKNILYEFFRQTFRNILGFQSEVLLAPYPSPKTEDHPLLVSRELVGRLV